MADWNLKSPLLEDMRIDECLSEGGGSATYLITHEPTDRKFIFKYISIPESQTHVDGLRYSGAIQTSAEAQAYYEKVAYGYKAELDNLQVLSEGGSIACYRAYHLQPKEEAVGFDLHLLTNYRQTLAQYMAQAPMTHLAAANLAMDLCTSLTELRQAGFIHCNIKPENIYLGNNGHFMIGDLGLFRIDDLKYAAVPERMLGAFAAPELFDVMQTPNTTVDIYTVGLILYSIFNGGHSIFEDEQTSARGASEMRLSGAALPAPIYADYEMTAILQKACAFAPEDRYQSPEELRDALMDYAQRNEPQDSVIVPPIVVDEDTQLTEEAICEEVEPVQFATAESLGEEFVQHFSPDTESLNEIIETIREEMAEEATDEADAEPATDETAADSEEETADESEDTETEEAPAEVVSAEETQVAEAPAPKEKKKAPFWVWIIAGVLALGAALVGAYFLLIPNVTEIAASTVTSNSIAITVASNHESAAFSATATDTYGNTVAATAQDGTLVFEALNPDTQYTVDVRMSNGLAVRGMDSVLIATEAATEILYFGAKPVSETQVELNFTIAGSDQESWTVRYGTSESDEKQATFSGHSTVISDLIPNSTYTFTLVGATENSLSGKTQLKYNTTVRVKVSEVLAQTNADGVTLNWAYTFTGEAPENWMVICYGPEGFMQETIVTEPTVTYTNLEKEKVYTLEIFCEGMAVPAEKTIRTADATISDLKVSVEDGVSVLSWNTDDEVADGWMIVCSLVESPESVTKIVSQETTVKLTGLLPECDYNVEVQTGSGMAVNGNSTAKVTTPKAAKYTANGLGSTYVGLFVEPASADWTYRNLASPRSSFKMQENIAFALEAMSGVSSSEDEIAVKIVVKNAEGIVSTANKTHNWNDMWDNKLYVGTPASTPQESGKYTLEIYFDGQLAGSANFTIN